MKNVKIALVLLGLFMVGMSEMNAVCAVPSAHVEFQRTRDGLPRNANSDGYIPKGNITLTSVVGKTRTTFKLYSKRGSLYILYYGNYIKLTGRKTVNIGHVQYYTNQ